MTAAYRLRGIGWFGGCAAVVLGFYLVSLQVAGERNKLERVDARIAAAERDIRALETEFDTRANLAQLEKWNGDTLALSAPTAGQFVSDETALAALDVGPMGAGPMGGPALGQVRTAALIVPSGAPRLVPSLAPQQAAMTLVAATAPVAPVITPQRVVAAARTVAASSSAAEQAPTRATAVRTAAVISKVRPQAVAMLERKLLSDSTLGDILATARTEAGKR